MYPNNIDNTNKIPKIIVKTNIAPLLKINKVENIYADESVITNDKIDASLLKAITYNSYTNEYYEVSNKVGNAFKDGLKLK